MQPNVAHLPLTFDTLLTLSLRVQWGRVVIPHEMSNGDPVTLASNNALQHTQATFKSGLVNT